MGQQYQTPGVYIQEENAFGSQIVANETAVPIFIGFTQKAVDTRGEKLPTLATLPDRKKIAMPVLINSQLGYQQHFGGPDNTGEIHVKEPRDGVFTAEIKKGHAQAPYTPGYLHPAIVNFFANGGGNAWVLSLGPYKDFKKNSPPGNLISVIKQAIEYAETCTLVVLTDLIRFGDDNYYSWCGELLNILAESKRQFLIMDVIQDTGETDNPSVYNEQHIKHFRQKMSSDHVKYGAAYFPYLKSLTPYAYDEDSVTFDGTALSALTSKGYSYDIKVKYTDGTIENLLLTASYQNLDPIKIPDIDVNYIVTGENNLDPVDNKITIEAKEDTGFDKADLILEWGVHRGGWELKFEGKIPNNTAKNTTFTTQVYLLNSWKSPDDNKSFPLVVTRAGGINANNTPNVYLRQGAPTDLDENQDNELTITIDLSKLNNAQELLDNINQKIQEIENDVKSKEIALKEAKEKFPLDDNAINTANDTLELTTKTYKSINAYKFAVNKAFNQQVAAADLELKAVAEPDNARVNQITTFLKQNTINMPPAAFMAGIYSRVDNSDGVWVSPANTAPVGVTGPLVDLTDNQQKNLNVDAVSGKSINAIRSFTGRGCLVWGARTTDGNSLDWRYINVRRLFIAMETDISTALKAYVFKPNVHNTWVEVKSMIDAYLYGLFQSGAFAGQTPEQSYQVLIGQGVTMTSDDILNGYLKVSIKVAAVRPAEFIELTFSQMLAE